MNDTYRRLTAHLRKLDVSQELRGALSRGDLVSALDLVDFNTDYLRAGNASGGLVGDLIPEAQNQKQLAGELGALYTAYNEMWRAFGDKLRADRRGTTPREPKLDIKCLKDANLAMRQLSGLYEKMRGVICFSAGMGLYWGTVIAVPGALVAAIVLASIYVHVPAIAALAVLAGLVALPIYCAAIGAIIGGLNPKDMISARNENLGKLYDASAKMTELVSKARESDPADSRADTGEAAKLHTLMDELDSNAQKLASEENGAEVADMKKLLALRSRVNPSASEEAELRQSDDTGATGDEPPAPTTR